MASGAYLTNDSYFNISNTPSKAPVALIILAKDSLIFELAFVNYIEYNINPANSLNIMI